MKLSKFYQPVINVITSDLRVQYSRPVGGLIADRITKRWAKQNEPLVRKVVEELKIKPENKLLEFGYGCGVGIELALEHLGPRGTFYGIEASERMHKMAENKYAFEVAEEGRVVLEKLPMIIDLPFPNNFFDAVYHIDVFYFWGRASMKTILKEIMRVIKPNGLLLCGMNFKRLEGLEKWGVIGKEKWDPMNYMVHLEPVGFLDVNIKYHKLPTGEEVQLIYARKPSEEEDSTYESKMASLEKDIKEFMAMESLMKSNQRDASLVEEAGMNKQKRGITWKEETIKKTEALKKAAEDVNEEKNTENEEKSKKQAVNQ
ncbi:unnamed protein product [Bursaphelenchus okinawaensis]|uniref:Methyltransferase type 11 domain-containing protein n=1 Tax=Bursaphelenchus okinawaensis TaxID=465554 RepID=A0A811LLE6_9BILA|nr:unnamed protein product [Bursaphelenchus okinawaensis]CAG9123579.1 unnamed protein product [Bursaphelenchus okinawaensis]